jgi:hypothetical protein
MIGVNVLYNEVQDITRAYEGGYLNNDEFNRAVNQAQAHLFSFLLEDSNVDRYTDTSLDPFKEETLITKSSGVYTKPVNFAAIREIAVPFILPTGATEYRPAYPIENLGLTMTSVIRKPTTKTFGYVFDTNFKLYPEKNIQILLKYFRNPVDAERKVTYAGDGSETYTPTGTVDLEWNATDKSIVLDLTLYYAAVTTSMPDLINWVQSKNSFIPSKNRDYITRRS